jgi:bifunctional UDP-N-acetylglucosamine pyrophosphorylase/glucosamine-1-phosphate N-acetyltransferase
MLQGGRMKNSTCIILAAGRSQRFPAPMGKICYPFIDRALCDHAIALATTCFEHVIIVLSSALESWFIEKYSPNSELSYVIQSQPKGTWDALVCALPHVQSQNCVVINGDVPLLSLDLLEKVSCSESLFALVTTDHPSPQGYGRIFRDNQGQFSHIVEDKDLSFSQKISLHEVNAGIYAFKVAFLKTITIEKALSCAEWYLTAIWSPGSQFLKHTQIFFEPDYRRVQGINTWADYELAEQYYYQLQREALVRQGAFLKNCHQIFVQKAFCCQPGVEITGPCVLQGPLELGEGSKIEAYSYLDSTRIEQQVQIGPFAKVTENTYLHAQSIVGSFVEIKRSTLGERTKAKHLSYIADATMGRSCNIGAFVVTCNYDGKKKHSTIVGDNVFIGATSQLIAPITIASRSYIGAGTTLTSNVEEHTIVTRRAPLKIRPNFQGEHKLCVELSQG